MRSKGIGRKQHIGALRVVHGNRNPQHLVGIRGPMPGNAGLVLLVAIGCAGHSILCQTPRDLSTNGRDNRSKSEAHEAGSSKHGKFTRRCHVKLQTSVLTRLQGL